MQDIKSTIDEYNRLLPTNDCLSTTEAERRAGEFLKILAILSDIRHRFGSEKIKLLSVQTAVYAQEMSKGTAKTMTENKLVAEASQEYTKAREELEGIENDLSYLKACQEIFTNAHVFYRHMAKGESY